MSGLCENGKCVSCQSDDDCAGLLEDNEPLVCISGACEKSTLDRPDQTYLIYVAALILVLIILGIIIWNWCRKRYINNNRGKYDATFGKPAYMHTGINGTIYDQVMET